MGQASRRAKRTAVGPSVPRSGPLRQRRTFSTKSDSRQPLSARIRSGQLKPIRIGTQRRRRGRAPKAREPKAERPTSPDRCAFYGRRRDTRNRILKTFQAAKSRGRSDAPRARGRNVGPYPFKALTVFRRDSTHESEKERLRWYLA